MPTDPCSTGTLEPSPVLPPIAPLRLLEGELQNGVRVVLAPMAHSKVIAGRLIVIGGSGCESEGESGCAHFLEHMCFCGTPTRPTTHAITREVERLGALLNAETTKEDTTYSFVCAEPHFKVVLTVLADMFLNSSIPPTSFDTERDVIREELKDNEDDLSWRCANGMERLIFGTSALSRPIIGTRESLSAITRDLLISCRSNWYVGSNTVLVLAGAVSEAHLEKVRTALEGTPVGNKALPPSVIAPSAERYSFEGAARNRTIIKVGFPLPGHEQLREPEAILAQTILGQTSYSRLERGLRLDRGLAYGLDCGYVAYGSGGYVEVSAEVSPGKVQKTFDALQSIFEDFSTRGVTEEELADAKSCGLGRSVIGSQTASDIADYVADEILTNGSVRQPSEHLKALVDVQLDPLNAFIKETFSADQCRIAVCGKVPKNLTLPFGI